MSSAPLTAAARMFNAAKIAAVLDTEHPGLAKWAVENAHWCAFASSLIRHAARGRDFSAKQIEILARIRATHVANVAAKAEAAAKTADIDFAPVIAMFEAATANGMKRPVFRAGKVTLSLAPNTGKNAGAVYVKEGQTYCGKISGQAFHPTAAGHHLVDLLSRIAADPKAAAIRYGRETGQCACCGRTLSDPKSVALGIGPICASRFGF